MSMLKNRTNRKLILKIFRETKRELKKKKGQEEAYQQGKRKEKPFDKFNNYWYGTMMIKQNNKYIDKHRIDRLYEILEINKELNTAYNLKEEFLRITTYTKVKEAKKELKNWIKQCQESNIPEMIAASNTINNWLDEVVNSFKDDRYSNGFTEANNNKIDKIVDRAYGYKNFNFFRLRALVILHKGYSGGSRKNIEKGKSKK